MHIKPTTSSLNKIYSGGSWDIKSSYGPELWTQNRRNAVEIVDHFKEGEATYTVWKENDFKTLPEEEQKTRLKEARDAGWQSAMEVTVMSGFLGLIGTAVMGVAGQVGSLVSTVMGGSGAVSSGSLMGLGVAAAVVGGAALISGISSYRMEKSMGLSEMAHQQKGTVKDVEGGFEFHPKEGSKDMTPVLITKKSITPLSEGKSE